MRDYSNTTTTVLLPSTQIESIWPLRVLKRGLVNLAAYHLLPWTLVRLIFKVFPFLRSI